MKLFLLSALILLTFSCEGNITTSSASFYIEKNNYNNYPDPRERWNSHKITNYRISEGWTCECLPPAACSAIIRNNKVDSVNFQISLPFYYGRTIEEIHRQTKDMALTVDEAFDLIDQYKSNAFKIEVDYHAKYGYPEKIYIDIDSMMVDEEIIRYFFDLERINK